MIQLVEGSLTPLERVINLDICDRSASCVTRGVWDEMKKAIDGVLESSTLWDLIERQRQKEHVEPTMYYICFMPEVKYFSQKGGDEWWG